MMKFNCLDSAGKSVGTFKANNADEALAKAKKLNDKVASVEPFKQLPPAAKKKAKAE